jgi:hypothetical protein
MHWDMLQLAKEEHFNFFTRRDRNKVSTLSQNVSDFLKCLAKTNHYQKLKAFSINLSFVNGSAMCVYTHSFSAHKKDRHLNKETMYNILVPL